MDTTYIFDFKLATPIVIEDVDKKNLKPIAEKLNIDYSVIDDLLHSRKSARFFYSEESDRTMVSYCVKPRQILNFNSFEIVNISEVDKKGQDKKSRIFHGSNAVKCLAVLAHFDLQMMTEVKIPLDVFNRCNHRQWVDISELVAKTLSRSERLGMLLSMDAPSIILVNEERVLQECVQFLECNTSLVRKDGTIIRALNDVEYSLIYGDESKRDESILFTHFDEETESGDVE